ncbi:MAG: outer membrane beta-barrel protein [Conchiformibius sp.]|nr:outer membrane beta-barrel protein [Conchiformibius sp.]
MKTKLLAWLAAVSFGMLSWQVQAEMITDAHGNVGYDTAAECDAAVNNGTAKFYEPFTSKAPLLRKGEKTVKTARIRDLGPEYARGACDIGVGHKLGRDGVSTALQGKFVPYSPDMPINAYANAAGGVVRVSMGVCDNWFSGSVPRPVAASAAKAEAAPAEPVVIEDNVAEVAPVVTAASGSKIRPYVFGTLGALRNELRGDANERNSSFRDTDAQLSGQTGVGIQFNKYLGAEVFYQGSRKHKYKDEITALNNNGGEERMEFNIKGLRGQSAGIRMTVGGRVGDKLHLFGKAGAAYTKYSFKKSTVTAKFLSTGDEMEGYAYGSDKKVRPIAGIGASYYFNDNLALRADYDHYFGKVGKDGIKFKKEDYLGLGLQYTF